MKTTHKFWFIASVLLIIILVIVVVMVSSHTNEPSLSAAAQNAAKQQINTNWQTFFASSTSLSNRESLLQDGAKFTQPIQSEFTSLSSASSSATVTNIQIVDATNANVTYTVNLNGKPVLTAQKGRAVKLNNKWLVSDSTLCGLLAMAGNKPAACQGL